MRVFFLLYFGVCESVLRGQQLCFALISKQTYSPFIPLLYGLLSGLVSKFSSLVSMLVYFVIRIYVLLYFWLGVLFIC